MRISVYLSPELVTRLKDLAWREHRHPRQQAEYLLEQAIIEKTIVPTPEALPDWSHAPQGAAL